MYGKVNMLAALGLQLWHQGATVGYHRGLMPLGDQPASKLNGASFYAASIEFW